MDPAPNIGVASGSSRASENAPTKPVAPGFKKADGQSIASEHHGDLAIRSHHHVPPASKGVKIISHTPDASDVSKTSKPPTTHEALPAELWVAILEHLDLPALRKLDLVSRGMQHKARTLIANRRFDLELRQVATPRHLRLILEGKVSYAYSQLEAPARHRRVRDVLRAALGAPSKCRGEMLRDTVAALTEARTGLGPRELILRAALLVRKPADVNVLLGAHQERVSGWNAEEVERLFTLLVGRAAVIETRAGRSLTSFLEELHGVLKSRVALPAFDVFVDARPADGLLPDASATLLREFSVRNHEARVWPSPRELLERDKLYGDTPNAAHFAYWLARVGPVPLQEILQMPADKRRGILEDYHVDRADAPPDEMEALLERVAAGTRPLETAKEVAEVLAKADRQTAKWPTWVEDRQQLLHVLGAHVARMTQADEHAQAMVALRKANDALPEERRLNVERYAR